MRWAEIQVISEQLKQSAFGKDLSERVVPHVL
jgi:hypothetical protein